MNSCASCIHRTIWFRTMIDLTDRVIQPSFPREPTPFRAANGNLKWHAPRRILQLLCGVLLIALPLTNGLRLDLRRDEFYFAWHKMAGHDLFLLFWVAMLGVALLSAVSFLYGRLWCGWVCPQTLASDFADSLRKRLDKAFRARPGQRSFYVARTLWVLGILGMSLGTGIILACYWLSPHTVGAAALAPWRDIPAGLTIYLTGGLIAADMLWLRRKFCHRACPYGPLISTLTDSNSLAVRFLTERADECISCHKCEVDCPMEIDIKTGVGQHGCIGCGECVDSCNDVLGRRGIAGLIEYRYGTEPERVTKTLTRAERWGLWDGRRLAIAATVPISLGIVLFLIYGTLPLSANLTANGAIERSGPQVRNTYSLTVGNGSPSTTRFALSALGLPSGRVEPDFIIVPGHANRTLPVMLISTQAAPGRTPVSVRLTAPRESKDLATIFYAPPTKK